MRLSNWERRGDKETRRQGDFVSSLPVSLSLYLYLSLPLLVSLSPCLPLFLSLRPSRSRSLSPLSSSSTSMERTKALRTGAGIRELAPRTDFQMISLNSTSGAASSLLKSSCAERCEPGAFSRFFSARSMRASRCLNGVRSAPLAPLVKELYIGVAAASYWLIGGSPRISSIVRSIPEVVYIVEST